MRGFSLLLFLNLFSFTDVIAQQAKPDSTLNTSAYLSQSDLQFVDSLNNNDFTIQYEITTEMGRRRSVADTYNGALKTVYVTTNMVKMKLTSLMRTQSIIFYQHPVSDKRKAVLIKESGKDKYLINISALNWPIYSKTELYVTPQPVMGDTAIVMGIKCPAYEMPLPDGKKLKAYILPGVNRLSLKKSEPFLELFPGFALRYDIVGENAHTVSYTATQVNFLQIPSEIFKIPLGLKQRKYVNKPGTYKLEIEDDTDADDNEPNGTGKL